MNTPKVLDFPGKKAATPKPPPSDQELARAVRLAHRKLIRAIQAAIDAGLDVELRLDASDRYAGNNVRRGLEPVFIRKF